MQGSTKISSGRGRPRAYDPDEVLGKVLDVFWRKGFTATSLDDLVEVTGVNRPSLYSGFGNKQDLYLKALQGFRNRFRPKLEQTLTFQGEKDTAAAALERYFDVVIDVYLGNASSPLGCPGFCTAVAEAVEYSEIRSALLEAVQMADGTFERFLRAAQRERRVSPMCEPESLALLLTATQHSLAIRARAGQSRTQLKNVVSAVMNMFRH